MKIKFKLERVFEYRKIGRIDKILILAVSLSSY